MPYRIHWQCDTRANKIFLQGQYNIFELVPTNYLILPELIAFSFKFGKTLIP